MLKIKVCGMCNPGNIREVAEAGPDIMGFIFHPGSIRYAGKVSFESLVNIVPDGILKAGVFVNEEPATVLRFVRLFKLDAIQLHGSEAPDYCDEIKSKGLIIIKAFGIDNSFDFSRLIPYLDSCDYFLFDTKTKNHGGSGSKFNWSKLDDFRLEKNFFLSGGIGYEDIDSLKTLSHKGFYGVDINSRFESSPGIKDAALVKAFIKGIKS